MVLEVVSQLSYRLGAPHCRIFPVTHGSKYSNPGTQSIKQIAWEGTAALVIVASVLHVEEVSQWHEEGALEAIYVYEYRTMEF